MPVGPLLVSLCSLIQLGFNFSDNQLGINSIFNVMKAVFLTSFLFQKVLESSKFKVVVFLNQSLTVGEKVEVIQGREGFRSNSSIKVFRYISSIYECEQITTDDYLVSIELSSLPIVMSDPSYGSTVKPLSSFNSKS